MHYGKGPRGLALGNEWSDNAFRHRMDVTVLGSTLGRGDVSQVGKAPQNCWGRGTVTRVHLKVQLFTLLKALPGQTCKCAPEGAPLLPASSQCGSGDDGKAELRC